MATFFSMTDRRRSKPRQWTLVHKSNIIIGVILSSCAVYALFLAHKMADGSSARLHNLTTDPGALNVNSHQFKIDARRAELYYMRNKSKYGNKADFNAINRLMGFLGALRLCGKDSFILVGGTNKGQLSTMILSQCPSVTFFGFEIQRKVAVEARETLKGYPNAQVLNLGWSDRAQSHVQIGGHSEGAGFYDPDGQREWKLQDGEYADTAPISDIANDLGIEKALFIIIDTEGHEPKVIRGMRLHLQENQIRFPLFQFELGGTWAPRDNRHGNDPWTQKDTVLHLQECGYLTFLVGDDNWLLVDWRFFEAEAVQRDEGFGPFVQGNVLALHREFTPLDLKDKIFDEVVWKVEPS